MYEFGDCTRCYHEPRVRKREEHAVRRASRSLISTLNLSCHIHHSVSDARCGTGGKQHRPAGMLFARLHAFKWVCCDRHSAGKFSIYEEQVRQPTRAISFLHPIDSWLVPHLLHKFALAALGRASTKVACDGGMLRVQHLLVPLVRVTRVLPGLRTWKMEGALMSYHSFRVMGSTLELEQIQHRVEPRMRKGIGGGLSFMIDKQKPLVGTHPCRCPHCYLLSSSDDPAQSTRAAKLAYDNYCC